MSFIITFQMAVQLLQYFDLHLSVVNVKLLILAYLGRYHFLLRVFEVDTLYNLPKRSFVD